MKHFISGLLFFLPWITLAHTPKESKQETVITCHYDETLTIDVWTSYSPPGPTQEFKDFIRKKYGKNVYLYFRHALKPEDF